jgi:hypothetical protein
MSMAALVHAISSGSRAENLKRELDGGWSKTMEIAIMTITLDDQGPNIFPLVEGIDVRDAGRTAEVIFASKVDGQLATLTIRLSYAQAATLAGPEASY